MDSITALTAQLDPMAPVPADDDKIYVDWQRDMQGVDDVKLRLVRTFGRSAGTPVTRLFTGHRGTGKTTELLRVQRMLMQGQGTNQVFVSFLECESWVDLNDVNPEDLVLQMVRQLVADLNKEGFGQGLERLQAFFREAWEILNSDVELKDLAIAGDPVKLGIAIKHIPGVRAKLRKFLEDRRPRLFELVNQQIISPGREWLKNKGYSDILLIVDELDRIPQKQMDDHGLTNHQQLFLNSTDALRALRCDVLYTIPIELAYSHCHGRLNDAYGGEILTLPMISVPGREDSGLQHLRDIIERRAIAAGLSLEDLCSREVLDRICRLSGGHPRSLFTLLRAALDRTDTLPLTSAVVQRAIRSQATDFAKSLSDDQWAAVKKVHETRDRLTGESERDLWMTFLRERYVYAYYDGEVDGLTYDWNPLLDEVRR